MRSVSYAIVTYDVPRVTLLEVRPKSLFGKLGFIAQHLCPLYRGLDARRAAWGLLQVCYCFV